jgi:hypothetical protein
MAISNCLFSPTSENPHGFSEVGVFLQILVLSHATTLSREHSNQLN